jgi:mannose-1-phosphate guanylyltransferase
VREYVERSPFARQVTLAEEPQLLGTAGTLIRNVGHFGAAPVLLAHADNLSVFSPRDFAAAHQSRPAGAAMTMMTFVTDAPQHCGIVKLDPRGTVVEFHEKSPNPPGNLASAAVYILEPEVIEFAQSRHAKDFSTEVVPHFVGRIHTFHNDRYHRDIGTLASLLQAHFVPGARSVVRAARSRSERPGPEPSNYDCGRAGGIRIGRVGAR